MKFFKAFKNSMIAVGILSVLTAMSAISFAQQNVNIVTREVNAKKQLLDHQRYLDLSAEKEKSKLITSIPSGPSRAFKNLKSASTIFFSDDMNSGVNGWTVISPTDSAAWYLESRYGGGPDSCWKAGTHSGTYQTGNRVYDVLISPQINLTGAIGRITLLFDEYYYTEQGWDFCMVDVTTDGGNNWTHLRGGYGESVSGDSRDWIITDLDLTPFANQTINLRYVFDTGDSLYNYFSGWMIDNVTVFDQTAWITGIVFFDQNQNGIYDTGERGILDVFLPFIDRPISSGMENLNNGRYMLPLPLGTYHMMLTPPYFHIPYFQPWITTAPDTLDVDLNISGQIDTINVGYYRTPCILSGRVFQDLNHNGRYNNGEPAFTEPVIELEDANFNLLAQTHADPTGQYSFQIFIRDFYSVQMCWLKQYGVSANWIPTTPNPDDPSTVQTYNLLVGSRDTLLNGLDFGSYESPHAENGTITGNIFNDLNQNGVRDNLEPAMNHCSIQLQFSGDRGFPSAITDSLGNFSFTGLPSGRYRVLLNMYGDLSYKWQLSLPAPPITEYYFQLDSNGIRDSVIFGLYRLPVSTVRGHIFCDLNRNGIEDPGERSWKTGVTIQGIKVYCNLKVDTDPDGNYSADTLPVGMYTISPWLPRASTMQHWRTIPPLPDTFTLAPSQVDTINWAIYPIVPGSVSGSLYNDINGDGVRDSGETPIKGATVFMNWDNNYGYGDYNTSTITEDSGNFRFYSVWSGHYILQLPMSAGWRQTEPSSLLPHFFYIGDEANLSGFEFGVTRDTTFNIAFRTFLPESLISDVYDNRGYLLKPMPIKPIGCEATFNLVAPRGGLNGLHLEFNTGRAPIDSLSATHFPPPVPFSQKYKWDFKLAGDDTLADGEVVTIFARWTAGKIFRINKYWWEDSSSTPADSTTVMRTVWPEQMHYLYAMPNLVNVFQSKPGSGSKINRTYLNVGLVTGPYSVSISTKSYKSIWASLADIYGNTHKGRPRCLDMGSSRGVIYRYPPTDGDNILFAEEIALKASILASDYQITPYGLGSLIFHGDSTNPFNGLSIRKILAKIDTAMSGYIGPTENPPTNGHCVCDNNFFDIAYQTIRMIDSAFSGPMDTIGQYAYPGYKNSSIVLKPVRLLADVPFLTVDSNFSSIAFGHTLGGNLYPEEPLHYSLDQNYPNPFNPTTVISFTLLQESFVTLKIYNILGQEVATLLNVAQMDEGSQEIEFNASNLPSGVYFYRIKAEGIADAENEILPQTFIAVKKMVLLK